MIRAEVWLAQVGRKRRPVLVLTRNGVIDVRKLVTVAEVTTTIRGLGAEVAIDHAEVGLDSPSVINCDGVHSISQDSLSGPIGEVDEATMGRVCSALSYALGC